MINNINALLFWQSKSENKLKRGYITGAAKNSAFISKFIELNQNVYAMSDSYYTIWMCK